jgi:hypothetical protein
VKRPADPFTDELAGVESVQTPPIDAESQPSATTLLKESCAKIPPAGGGAGGAGAVTITVRLTVPFAPPLSVTVRLTVYVPDRA